MISLEEGKKLVKAARDAVFSDRNSLDGFEERRGIFVTINSHPDGKLRGCIGFPEAIFPLNEALIKAAKAAAFNDPRFSAIKNKDKNKVVFEVSVLTQPELIEAKEWRDYLNKIEIGKDGLIIDAEGFRGLLLPQVFPENKVDVEKALSMTCVKAGIIEDTWKQPSCRVFKFQAQIFSEKKPDGDIEEKRFI